MGNQIFLEDREEIEVAMLVTAKTNGATPLIVACRNGHYDVAEYLIQKCNADIEQPGSVVFDGGTVEGAPPLWCASAAGYLNIVKLLVKHGACVNSKTNTLSTPLRAACFDGYREIVKFLVDNGADIEAANIHGHTSLMIACYKKHYSIAKYLLSVGADVNRKSLKGNTALHDCAESGSLEILQLLMAHGAKMDVDCDGMTPLLSASVMGHKHIVEYLIKLPDLISHSQRVDALELLGATYVDKYRDMSGALALWKRAMLDRLFSQNKLPKPPQLHTVAVYDNVTEINDMEGLEDLLGEPDQMKMQALVIRERIIGPNHPDTTYYIRCRGAAYANAGKYDRCIDLWNYALDMQLGMKDPLMNQLTQNSFSSFIELFSSILSEESRAIVRSRRIRPFSFTDVATVYIKAINELKVAVQLLEKVPAFERDTTSLQRPLVICLHLGCLVTKVMDKTLPEEEELKQTVYKKTYQLVKLGVKGKNGRSALHLACSRESALDKKKYADCRLPSASLAQLLLKVGADPKAKDDDGNTPLHTAVDTSSDPVDLALVTVLLDHGVHIDSVNAKKKSVEQRLESLMFNTIKYKTLACFAAKALNKYTKKEYYINQIPKTLVPFVEYHC